jgi:hypothetical protein
MAWRILVLTGSSILCGIICLLSIAACSKIPSLLQSALSVLNLYFTVGGFLTSLALTFTPRLADIPSIRLGPTLWLMSSAVCDVMITTCLVWSLVSLSIFGRCNDPKQPQSTKKTGFKDMDSYLTHVIRRMDSYDLLHVLCQSLSPLVAIQTGALTSVATMGDAIVFLSLPVRPFPSCRLL